MARLRGRSHQGRRERHEHGGDKPVPTGVARRLAEPLAMLVQAHDYASDLEVDAWQFAVELEKLRRVGIGENDLRWLQHRGYVETAVEITLPGEVERSFRHVGRLVLDQRTGLILTVPGALFARQAAQTGQTGWTAQLTRSPHGNNGLDAGVPHWDRDRQQLRVGRAIVKQFKVPAPNQEMILAAFEEEGWPVRIDDPLPPKLEQDPKRRLHDTINSLNRNQTRRLVHFSGDGSGEGVRWELVP